MPGKELFASSGWKTIRHGLWRTSLRTEELRLGKPFRLENGISWNLNGIDLLQQSFSSSSNF
jgi:hypothetical protein